MMKSTKNCEVLFISLIETMWKNNQDDPRVDKPLYFIDEIIAFIMKQAKKNKFFDLKDGKFCFLESGEVVSSNDKATLIQGYFKSARNEFRPDLINRRTGVERKNPKELAEGDIEKTHFAIKIDKEAKEVYFFLEYNFHGVSEKNAVNYFSAFHVKHLASKDRRRNSSIKHLLIPRNNFMTELERISRTRLAEIYFDKQLLGSKALNFSNKTVSIKKDLKLIATAEPHESITEVAVDFYNKLNGKKSAVSKVRIYGNDENNNEIILDTSFMCKAEFVLVDLNPETGDVNTTQLLTGLRKIANSF